MSICLTMRSIFCGALPWPATLNLGFQRETEEGSDQHNSTQQPDTHDCKRGGNRRDNICTHKQLKPE
jgi:hypothetical protein